MDELLNELKLARQEEADAAEIMKTVLNEFMASDDVYTFQKEHRARRQAVIAVLEERIRTTAIKAYESDGNKKPHEKVVIKIFKTFKVLDQSKVWRWALTNLPVALKLDEKKVEKYVLEFGDIEGTERGEEARAQIASEL